MAELADALDSGSSGRKAVQVQVLFLAPAAVAAAKIANHFVMRDFFLPADRLQLFRQGIPF